MRPPPQATGNAHLPVDTDRIIGRSALLGEMRDLLRRKHYSIRTEQAYLDWAKRYILFHGKRHPKEMGGAEIGAFLTHLAVQRKVAASTQNQALNALVFIYKQVRARISHQAPAAAPNLRASTALRSARALNVLPSTPARPACRAPCIHAHLERLATKPGEKCGLGSEDIELGNVTPAKRPQRLPTVFDRGEVARLFSHIEGVHRLVALILYGAGLRLLEALRLRIQDIEFARSQIVVRDGKGEMVYTHVMNKGPMGVRSPLNQLVGP